MKAALYLRASTAQKTRTADGEEAFRQRPEIQEERLRRLCEQRGWEVAAVYGDRASGRKEARPQLQQLMDDARRGLFGIVAVVAFDRFAESVKHLVNALDEFSGAWRPVHFASRGYRHVNGYGQGDVHDHRRDGRT